MSISSKGSALFTHNFGTIMDGDMEAVSTTVIGAELGDLVIAATMDSDYFDLQLTATVTAADTVTLVMSNSTGSNVDPFFSTFRVAVIDKEIAF